MNIQIYLEVGKTILLHTNSYQETASERDELDTDRREAEHEPGPRAVPGPA